MAQLRKTGTAPRPSPKQLVTNTLKDVDRAVKEAAGYTASEPGQQMRRKALPGSRDVLEVDESSHLERRSGTKFVPIMLTGSNGRRFKVSVPSSYVTSIPKVWSWDPTRFKVAEQLAAGRPIKSICADPDIDVTHPFQIYAWLEHPEFKEHVDGMVTETEYASRRGRISGLNRLINMLFEKTERELESMPLTDKAVGPVLTTILQSMKQIAQEKGEFVERSQVESETKLTGTLTTATVRIDELIKNTESEETRAKLEAEFDRMGDDAIRALTGGSLLTSSVGTSEVEEEQSE